MAKKSPFQVIREQIPAPLRSRYTLVLIVFTIWMLFFDNNDIFNQIRIYNYKTELNENNQYYEQKIEEVRLTQESIDEDVEKFAREKYFMKQPNEDVFVIVEE